LKNSTYVTLNEVKGLLTLAESTSRRFFAALRMTRGGFFNSPTVPRPNPETMAVPKTGCPCFRLFMKARP
jgi:hypothetical protein